MLRTDDGGTIGIKECPIGTTLLDALRKHSTPIHETFHMVHKNTNQHHLVLLLVRIDRLSHSNIISNLYQFETVKTLAFPSNQKLIYPVRPLLGLAWQDCQPGRPQPWPEQTRRAHGQGTAATTLFLVSLLLFATAVSVNPPSSQSVTD